MTDVKKWRYKPLLLLLYPVEKQDYSDLWEDFKYSYKLEDVREYLASCMECCICTENNSFSNPIERSNITHFLSTLMSLLEAKYCKDLLNDDEFRQFIAQDTSTNY